MRLKLGRRCCRLGMSFFSLLNPYVQLSWLENMVQQRSGKRRQGWQDEMRLMTSDSAYCGLPSGMEAFRVADRVLNEMQEKGELVGG